MTQMAPGGLARCTVLRTGRICLFDRDQPECAASVAAGAVSGAVCVAVRGQRCV